MQTLREYRPTARVHPDPDLLSPTRRVSRSRYFLNAVALPCAALLTLAAVWSWSARTVPPEYPADPAYATTVGGYQRIALDDGSVVELNASTHIRVHYSLGERRVELLRGEAHFTVAKNLQRPFRVLADGVAVRAVGTA